MSLVRDLSVSIRVQLKFSRLLSINYVLARGSIHQGHDVPHWAVFVPHWHINLCLIGLYLCLIGLNLCLIGLNLCLIELYLCLKGLYYICASMG